MTKDQHNELYRLLGMLDAISFPMHGEVPLPYYECVANIKERLESIVEELEVGKNENTKA